MEILELSGIPSSISFPYWTGLLQRLLMDCFFSFFSSLEIYILLSSGAFLSVEKRDQSKDIVFPMIVFTCLSKI